jgi:hypothetical protein
MIDLKAKVILAVLPLTHPETPLIRLHPQLALLSGSLLVDDLVARKT